MKKSPADDGQPGIENTFLMSIVKSVSLSYAIAFTALDKRETFLAAVFLW